MPNYRLYCLDATGRISLADEIAAASDEQAIAKARELKPGALRCEVWEDHRLVAALDVRDVAN